MADERNVDVSADDDLFDDQIADAIWEAASNGDGRITAASLRRELALLGIQIVSKAYYDSIAAERDELASKLAEADALAKHYEKCCDSYADENQKFHDRFTSAESALTAANAEIARLKAENEWRPIESAPKEMTTLKIIDFDGTPTDDPLLDGVNYGS